MAEPTALVRTLTGLDADEITDQQIVDLLEINDDTVKLAAADALERVAGQLEDVESDDIKLTSTRRTAVLMARAARLREQAAADDEDDGFFFDVVPTTPARRGELTERSRW